MNACQWSVVANLVSVHPAGPTQSVQYGISNSSVDTPTYTTQIPLSQRTPMILMAFNLIAAVCSTATTSAQMIIVLCLYDVRLHGKYVLNNLFILLVYNDPGVAYAWKQRRDCRHITLSLVGL